MAFATISSVANAGMIDIIVPAYADPNSGGGPLMWSSLVATARDPSRQFQLHVILNPASGPGTPADTRYLDASGNGLVRDLRDAGAIVDGYVDTSNGARAIADVKADIDAYLKGQYAGFVRGIFFDQMSNDLANVGYYKELNDYVKMIQADAHTFGNPGTTFTTNPTGQTTFTAQDYVNSLDTIMSFENSASQYATNYTSFPYLEGLDPKKIAHIVHTNPTWDRSLLDTAASRGAGYLYVTDDVFIDPLKDNPYDTLTSYWGRFTADVSARNAVVPEPASGIVALLGLCGLTGAIVRRARRQSQFVQG